jgi:hypothetical protein
LTRKHVSLSLDMNLLHITLRCDCCWCGVTRSHHHPQVFTSMLSHGEI